MDLNSLVVAGGEGFSLKIAAGINDLGQIVGTGTFDPDGPGPMSSAQRGFLLTPVPEPGMAGLMGVAVLCRRARRTGA